MSKNKNVVLPDETIEKLLNNEFQMNSVGTDEVEIPVVEPINEEIQNEEIQNEEAEGTIEEIEYNEVDYKSRGFKSLDDAIDFMETAYFKGLGEADKNEYKKWLFK